MLASDVSVVPKSPTNNCVMNVPISGCVDRRYGYCAPHDHAITFKGTRRDHVHLERRLPGLERREGPLEVKKNGVYDFPASAGQVPEDVRLMQVVWSVAV